MSFSLGTCSAFAAEPTTTQALRGSGNQHGHIGSSVPSAFSNHPDVALLLWKTLRTALHPAESPSQTPMLCSQGPALKNHPCAALAALLPSPMLQTAVYP